jgi:hypothetical protein
VEIHRTARKHGISDDSIRHACEHALYSAEDVDDSDKALYLGPDLAGNLLEVVTAIFADGTERAIHAMPMRSQYEPLLRGIGDDDDA